MAKTTKMDARIIEFTIKGETYKMTETTLGDFSALRDHIKQKQIKSVMAIEGLEPGERSVLLSDVIRKPITDIEMGIVCDSMDGQMFLSWRALQTHHSELTLDDLMSLFGTGEDAIKEMSAIQIALNAPDEEDEKNV